MGIIVYSLLWVVFGVMDIALGHVPAQKPLMQTPEKKRRPTEIEINP